MVEVVPNRFKQLLTKNRKAYKANVCASVFPHPHQIKFRDNGLLTKLVSKSQENRLSREQSRGLWTAQCLPFYSLLLAVGNPTVDLFILDVEGVEVSILKTIPFDKVDIKYFYIECGIKQQHNGTMLHQVMTAGGYEVVRYNNFNVLYGKK